MNLFTLKTKKVVFFCLSQKCENINGNKTNAKCGFGNISMPTIIQSYITISLERAAQPTQAPCMFFRFIHFECMNKKQKNKKTLSLLPVACFCFCFWLEKWMCCGSLAGVVSAELQYLWPILNCVWLQHPFFM